MSLFKKNASNEYEKTVALIVAAGRSSRMDGENKQFSEILGKPVLAYSLKAFQAAPSIDEIYVVAREKDILLVGDILKSYGISKAVSVVPGGNTRQQSVKNGLDAAGTFGIVAIHDGARPCILSEQIELAIAKAEEFGASAVGCPSKDTMKIIGRDNLISGTVDRNVLWQIQTPQVFARDIIMKAHENAVQNNIRATDDCALAEAIGAKICAVEVDTCNIKITTPEDLHIACSIIERRGEGVS